MMKYNPLNKNIQNEAVGANQWRVKNRHKLERQRIIEKQRKKRERLKMRQAKEKARGRVKDIRVNPDDIIRAENTTVKDASKYISEGKKFGGWTDTLNEAAPVPPAPYSIAGARAARAERTAPKPTTPKPTTTPTTPTPKPTTPTPKPRFIPSKPNTVGGKAYNRTDVESPTSTVDRHIRDRNINAGERRRESPNVITPIERIGSPRIDRTKRATQDLSGAQLDTTTNPSSSATNPNRSTVATHDPNGRRYDLPSDKVVPGRKPYLAPPGSASDPEWYDRVLDAQHGRQRNATDWQSDKMDADRETRNLGNTDRKETHRTEASPYGTAPKKDWLKGDDWGISKFGENEWNGMDAVEKIDAKVQAKKDDKIRRRKEGDEWGIATHGDKWRPHSVRATHDPSGKKYDTPYGDAGAPGSMRRRDWNKKEDAKWDVASGEKKPSERQLASDKSIESNPEFDKLYLAPAPYVELTIAQKAGLMSPAEKLDAKVKGDDDITSRQGKEWDDANDADARIRKETEDEFHRLQGPDHYKDWKNSQERKTRLKTLDQEVKDNEQFHSDRRAKDRIDAVSSGQSAEDKLKNHVGYMSKKDKAELEAAVNNPLYIKHKERTKSGEDAEALSNTRGNARKKAKEEKDKWGDAGAPGSMQRNFWNKKEDAKWERRDKVGQKPSERQLDDDKRLETRINLDQKIKQRGEDREKTAMDNYGMSSDELRKFTKRFPNADLNALKNRVSIDRGDGPIGGGFAKPNMGSPEERRSQFPAGEKEWDRQFDRDGEKRTEVEMRQNRGRGMSKMETDDMKSKGHWDDENDAPLSYSDISNKISQERLENSILTNHGQKELDAYNKAIANGEEWNFVSRWIDREIKTEPWEGFREVMTDMPSSIPLWDGWKLGSSPPQNHPYYDAWNDKFLKAKI